MSTPNTGIQGATNAILDLHGKQTYLGKYFSTNTNLQDIADVGVEIPFLYLNNPSTNATSTTTTNLSQSLALFLATRKFSVSGGLISQTVFNLYFNPTITSTGTPLTISNLRPASANVSKMQSYLFPTATNNGTFFSLASDNLIEVDSNILVILDPGQSILVTINVVAETSIATELTWYEL